MKKKAQVTIFIIIGIIVVLAAGVGIYFYTQSVQQQAAAEAEKAIAETPEAQVRNYVESCLKNSVLKGLELMRLQGGYISVPNDIETLEIDGYKVPYWLTDKEMKIPSLIYMQDELSRYVAYDLQFCINDFKTFAEKGISVSITSLNVVTEFAASVNVNMKYPLEIVAADKTTTLEDFSLSIPINFEQIYTMASDIANIESTYAFLEEHTNKMISMYSGVNENSLPPLYASRFNIDCSRTTWSVSEAELLMKKIIAKTVPYIKVEGTDFTRPKTGNPIESGVLDGMTYRFFAQAHPTLMIDFEYNPEWPFKFNIVPTKGGKIVPEKTKSPSMLILPSFCVFEYRSKYDVEYPVVVSITDKESARISGNVFYPNEGFTFKFPLYSFITRNNPRTREIVKLSSFINTDELTAAFKELTNKTIDFSLCQRLESPETKITVKDYLKNQPLPNVDVVYKCGDSECEIGSTDTNGQLAAKYPSCSGNAQIVLSKFGYADILTDYKNQDMNFVLFNKKEFTVKVKKINLADYMQNYISTGSYSTSGLDADLQESESAMITITGLEPVSLMYIPGGEIDSMPLSPGKYNLSLYLIKNINIRGEELNSSVFNNESRPTNSTTLPRASQVIYNSLNLEFEVANDDMSKNFLTLYAFEEPISGDVRWRDLLADSSILQPTGELRYRQDNREIVIAKEKYLSYMKPRFS